MAPLSASRIYTKYTPPRRKLAQPIAPPVLPGQPGQDRRDQSLRRGCRRHRIQAVEQPPEILELSAGFGVVGQEPIELPRLIRRGRAVENLVHQAYELGALHQSDPKSASIPRSSLPRPRTTLDFDGFRHPDPVSVRSTHSCTRKKCRSESTTRSLTVMRIIALRMRSESCASGRAAAPGPALSGAGEVEIAIQGLRRRLLRRRRLSDSLIAIR